MGTNFYFETNKWKQCGHAENRIHIGKSSYGWYFALHVIPEMNINNLEDWRNYIKNNEGVILDEYGDELSYPELIDTIANRSYEGKNNWSKKDYHDNWAEPGINGLARHKIIPNHCIGHGEGTYDYIIGEFS